MAAARIRNNEATPDPANVTTPSLRIALVAAVAALLARDAQCTSILPTGIDLALQLPLLALWLRTRVLQRPIPSDRRIEVALFIAVAVGASLIAIRSDRAVVAFIAITGYVAGSLALQWLANQYRRLDHAITDASQVLRIIARPWLACVVAATLLLALPIATKPGVADYKHNFASHVISSGHAAVSASCLVGVFTFDFGDEFTRFGQLVIIVLTQLAGFAFAAVGLSLVRPMLFRPPSLRTVYLAAAALQVVAIAVMHTAWHAGDASTASERVWWSLVHAGSALWNSGVTLRPDGLAAYAADRQVFLTISSLAIAGSLGIPIFFDLLRSRTGRDETPNPLRGVATFDAFAAFGLLSLLTLGLWFFEHPGFRFGDWRPALPFEPSVNQPALVDTPQNRWKLSVLVAATLRSAGLQAIPISQGTLTWTSLGLMIGAMIVGGGVGGTAGGMRTSIAGVAFGALMLRDDTKADSRSGSLLRRSMLRRIASGIMLWLVLNALAAVALSLTTTASTYDTTLEAVAALNSVGISTGLTPHLTILGRLVAIAIMIAGRFLPLIFWANLLKNCVVSSNDVARTASVPD